VVGEGSHIRSVWPVWTNRPAMYPGAYIWSHHTLKNFEYFSAGTKGFRVLLFV
jgi:hypothetical protein